MSLITSAPRLRQTFRSFAWELNQRCFLECRGCKRRLDEIGNKLISPSMCPERRKTSLVQLRVVL